MWKSCAILEGWECKVPDVSLRKVGEAAVERSQRCLAKSVCGLLAFITCLSQQEEGFLDLTEVNVPQPALVLTISLRRDGKGEESNCASNCWSLSTNN